MKYWLLSVASLILLISACELESDDCTDAKAHLCEKIQGQSCSTETMQNAVDGVSEACGASESTRFAGAVEDYCSSSSSDFDQEVCGDK